MKREIKFRIWNGSEMIYNILVGKFGAFEVNEELSGDGLNPDDKAQLSTSNTKVRDYIEPMQFTGLCDKKGKDIYEGDILKVPTNEGEVESVVVYSLPDCAFYCEFQDGTQDFISLDSEVVGNIFQNSSW